MKKAIEGTETMNKAIDKNTAESTKKSTSKAASKPKTAAASKAPVFTKDEVPAKLDVMLSPIAEVSDTISIGITSSYFHAVAKQRLPAHDAAMEIVDNATQNPREGKQALVLVSVDQVEDNPSFYRITIADWGRGMNAATLTNAMQFGSKHTNEGYLCIHGTGLCNALLVLSQHKYSWLVASKTPDEEMYNIVTGPFSLEMPMHSDVMPLEDIVMREKYAVYGKPSTIVSVIVDRRTISTALNIDGNCAAHKVKNANTIRRALAEHFGVKCRGFLMNSPTTGEPPVRILMTNFAHADGRREDVFLNPIFQPYIESDTKRFNAIMPDEAGNAYEVTLTTTSGILDKEATKNLVMGEYPTEMYYLHNPATQGFDIQLGGRVIATGQMESIWGKAAHSTTNAWTGSVVIDVEKANLPRGFLNTLANKSDIDGNDPNWQAIFEKIRSCITPRETKNTTVAAVVSSLVRKIMDEHPSHYVLEKHPVYEVQNRIDAVDVYADESCVIHAVVKGHRAATTADLNEMRMFWDGMVAQDHQPTAAYLHCREIGPMVRHYCKTLNTMHNTNLSLPKTTPIGELPCYNIILDVDPLMPV